MARKVLTHTDFGKNELQNAVAQNLPTAPSSPVKGQFYFNSTGGDNTLYWYDGTVWVAAKAVASVPLGSTATTAAMGDASAGGASTNVSREDHKHGMPAFGAATADTTFGSAKNDGAATTVARSDHIHGNPVHDGAAHSAIPLSALSAPFAAITAETTFGTSSGNGASTSAARADHTHGNPTHDAAAHSAISRSALAAPTADLAMGGFKLTGLGTPTAGTDAVTKDYADNMQAGLAWKDSCRLATTANDTRSGLAARDGVTPIANDRVLVKNQTNGQENGIFLAAAGAWSRALDANTAAEVLQSTVFVEEGTQADTAWTMTTNAPITLDTTPLVWVQFGAGTAYTGGAGLTLTGSTFDVGQGAGIIVAANAISADFAGTGSAGTVARSDHTHALMARIFSLATVGGATSQIVNHALNTRAVVVSVYANSGSFEEVDCDIEHTDLNNVTLRFTAAPGANAYTCVVVGI